MKLLSRLTGWYFSKSALPYWGVLILDSLIVLCASYVGAYVEVGATALLQLFAPITWGVLITLLFYVVSFRLFHTYSGIIRYSSFIDLKHVVLATLLGALLSASASLVAPSSAVVHMPGILGASVTFLIATLLMWFMRLLVKLLFDNFRVEQAVPVAIYGTKAGGVSLANSITSIKNKEYRLVAFISDTNEMKNATLMGKKIYTNGEGIADTMKRIGVKTLLVSPLKSELFRKNTAMVDAFLAADIKIMMMPAAEEWDGTSELTHQSLREVDIEDLLPREKIEVDMEAIGAQLRDQVILITGAAGSIGSEMVRQVALFRPASMVLIDQAETPMHDVRLMMSRQFPDIQCETIVSSISNAEHMERLFAAHRPSTVTS